MHRIRGIFGAALIFALASLSLTVQAQRRPYRATDQQVAQVIQRIENRTDTFRTSLANRLDRSRIDGTATEDDINRFVSDFETATDRLRNRFENRRSVAADVQNVLDRAAVIDNFVRNNRLGARTQREWTSLRLDLSELARYYNVSWNWDNTSYSQNYPQNNYPQNNYPQDNYPNRAGNRLTGTYRLDATRSDDARAIAERETRNLSYRDRQRVLDQLTARLESPTALAIDRRGRSVTIASSRSPQFTFEADGVERVETGPTGRSVRVRSSLYGDQLTVTSTGDRGSDFNVTFDPIEGGRRLRVTRRISDINLNTPLTVVSLYDKTSEVAQLDIYNSGPNYPNNGGVVATNGDFIVPDGTQLVGVLNTNLTTRDTRDNDRFTMTVRSPMEYEGATINGYVSNISRSGRVTGRSEMTLNFDTITLRDGRSYRFAGITETVRTVDGDTIRVDNEGSVRDNNRTNTTAKRAAIGTAVGAIIGAIAGGGKGAAVGAIIGAGAGAGSVYVQGKDDLELLSGTEVTVRASGPIR